MPSNDSNPQYAPLTSTSKSPTKVAGATITHALDEAFGMLMDERVGQFQGIFEEIDRRFSDLGSRVVRLDEEKAELQEAYSREVVQRHHETNQINTVLKQLEYLFEQRDNREVERRKQSITCRMQQAVYRMNRRSLAAHLSCWVSHARQAARQNHVRVYCV
jgi:hypothetical protein